MQWWWIDGYSGRNGLLFFSTLSILYLVLLYLCVLQISLAYSLTRTVLVLSCRPLSLLLLSHMELCSLALWIKYDKFIVSFSCAWLLKLSPSSCLCSFLWCYRIDIDFYFFLLNPKDVVSLVVYSNNNVLLCLGTCFCTE